MSDVPVVTNLIPPNDLENIINDAYFQIYKDVSQWPLNNRRFSFSVPDDKPTGPQNMLTIQVPVDIDAEPESDSPLKTPNDIQSAIGFSKELLLISSQDDTKYYKRPPRKSIDAYKVWRAAKIPDNALIRDIEIKLIDWAFTYAQLKIIDNKIALVSWFSHSKCICTCSWTTFLKWIMCASLEV
jgi:hypothetical protein